MGQKRPRKPSICVTTMTWIASSSFFLIASNWIALPQQYAIVVDATSLPRDWNPTTSTTANRVWLRNSNDKNKNLKVDADHYSSPHVPTRVTGYGKRAKHRGNTLGTNPTSRSGLWLYQPNNDAKMTMSSSETSLLQLYSSRNNCTIQITTNQPPQQQCFADNNNNNNTVSPPPNGLSSVPGEESSDWKPIDGIYGVYHLPSGQLWVLIGESRVVYQAPPLCSSRSSSSSSSSPSPSPSWWTIRRITQLHLVHVVHNENDDGLSRGQNMEEQRQIQLLRHAMKHHEWYYCETTKDHPDETEYNNNNNNDCGGFLVPDMTRRLQTCLLEDQWHQQEQQQQTNNTSTARRQKTSWYNASALEQWQNENNETTITPEHIQSMILPDPRFFWNQALVEPFLRLLIHHSSDDHSSSSSSSQSAPLDRAAVQVLLDHVIPVTSAFCGVQKNLTITSPLTSTPASSSVVEAPESIPTAAAAAAASSTTSITDQPLRLSYDQILITRRSRFRAGTRFTKRGADHTGAVANYAETEQIVLVYQNTTGGSSRLMESPTATLPNNETASTNATAATSRANPSHSTLTAVCSHVQTRGSIPLRWSSPTDIKTYRPRVRIGTDPLAQARALLHHLTDQISRYVILPDRNQSHRQLAGHIRATRTSLQHQQSPSLVFVNLVDKKSDQGRLGRAFDAVLKAVLDVYSSHTSTLSLPKVESGRDNSHAPRSLAFWLAPSTVKHVWYDFHAEVKHGRWDKLVTLLDEVKPSLASQGYFRASPTDSLDSNGDSSVTLEIDQLQTGVIRTNCMDCLDRTNVVQSMFGRYILFSQLSDLKPKSLIPLSTKTAFRLNPMSLPWKESEVSHRLLWADNADAISRLYAGTPALKGDFTRTGKRTKKGALDDGMNSLQRYYLNNFMDADRQEGVDLLVGFQPFSGLGDSDEVDMIRQPSKASSQFMYHGMSIQDAARRALLGSWHGAHETEGDNDHVRIKLKTRYGHKHVGPLPVVGGAIRRRLPRLSPSSLDLRWLPGDLQTQVRSLAASASTASDDAWNDFMSPYALKAMDERSASDLPWWVVTANDSSDSEAESTTKFATTSTGLSSSSIPAAATAAAVLTNGGFLFGAMLAASQSPVGLAMVVLALVAASYVPIDEERKDIS